MQMLDLRETARQTLWCPMPIRPAIVDRARELVGSSEDDRSLAKSLAALFEEHDLTPSEMGDVAATSTADWPMQRAEALLWTELGNLRLTYLSDFLDVCRTEELAALCGGFITARMRLTDESAFRNGTALGTTWTIRLTGYPLLYGYAELADIHLFARAMIEAVMKGACNPTASDRQRFVTHLIARVGEGTGPELDPALLA